MKFVYTFVALYLVIAALIVVFQDQFEAATRGLSTAEWRAQRAVVRPRVTVQHEAAGPDDSTLVPRPFVPWWWPPR